MERKISYSIILFLILLFGCKSNSDKGNDYFIESKVLFASFNGKGALTKISYAIELDPTNYNYYFFRGIIYQEMGQINKSLDDYSKAIELNSNFARAYFNRGCLYSYWYPINNENKIKGCNDFKRASDLGDLDAKEHLNNNCK